MEFKLQKELSSILNQEELMWHQRSRTQWLVDRDRNDKFYHMHIIARRKKNMIIMLKNEDGEWLFDPDVSRNHVSES